MQQFIKQNTTNFSDALLKEADGLKLLQKYLQDNPFLHTPKLFKVTNSSLHMQQLYPAPPTKKLSQDLAKGLAQLHKSVHKNYGLNYDNYIGLNPQKNQLSQNWGEFFVSKRLAYQVGLLKDTQLQKEFSAILNTKKQKLQEFLNETCSHPSLVHGDLWSGNVIYEKQKVYLIDPAVYFGDSEVDIAMSELFGGFLPEFYTTYNVYNPLTSHYPTKKIIYNVYHYLNHYNLFGSSYLHACKEGFETIKGL